ncbi:MAG: sugar phosphate isomerase/epimerase [Clostridia bacterium]|nr:sugar phosphate isomerase/epimerase [Clostridia bacterium]
MNIGVLLVLNDDRVEEKIARVREFGFDYCQFTCWNHSLLTDELAERIVRACEKYSVKISTLWVGWSGPAVWDFIEGPAVLGIVPVEYRYARMQELMHGSDFAKKLGVGQIATHMGFLPESPVDPQYLPMLAAIRHLADHCKANGQYLLFETGQETPVTVLRFIEDSGRDNLGVNLDPANLIMYGKANPIDALTVFGKYVRDVHAKDGKYPTCGRELGPEVPIGEGEVNFPALVKRLKEIGYDGVLTIEREIEGDEQTRDIIAAKKLLERLV